MKNCIVIFCFLMNLIPNDSWCQTSVCEQAIKTFKDIYSDRGIAGLHDAVKHCYGKKSFEYCVSLDYLSQFSAYFFYISQDLPPLLLSNSEKYFEFSTLDKRANKYLNKKGSIGIQEEKRALECRSMETGIPPKALKDVLEANKKIPEGKEAQQKELIVKGFYLGMPIVDTIEIIKKQYDKVFREIEINTEIKSLKAILVTSTYLGSLFRWDNNNRLTYMEFDPESIGRLFNAVDMSPKDFAQTFVNSYNIPRLNGESNEYNVPVWRYKSDKGFEIIISSWEKRLVIRTIPKSLERKFD